ncbi:uncharacterized protein K489DRAFT_409806 [Dissoconium aciculare CBS 342.82]|uniref:Uncharacterized protein n=1 Tax=Dissoconium aciculare CBS 342.82 TaxID=1314786 RepID=A0A6J3M443_9PEZI|nr:uncharacterized protein K489DRAFT_409806 [Dissoconium aciculare CBS 342.82]KAF1822668.1 hypothetical protein K489DRAFT_409806 [Dissoconium aciculare CBS 342.82]
MSGLQRDKRDRNPPEWQECTFDEVRSLNPEAFICRSFTGREKVFKKGTYVCVAKAVGLEGWNLIQDDDLVLFPVQRSRLLRHSIGATKGVENQVVDSADATPDGSESATRDVFVTTGDLSACGDQGLPVLVEKGRPVLRFLRCGNVCHFIDLEGHIWLIDQKSVKENMRQWNSGEEDDFRDTHIRLESNIDTALLKEKPFVCRRDYVRFSDVKQSLMTRLTMRPHFSGAKLVMPTTTTAKAATSQITPGDSNKLRRRSAKSGNNETVGEEIAVQPRKRGRPKTALLPPQQSSMTIVKRPTESERPPGRSIEQPDAAEIVVARRSILPRPPPLVHDMGSTAQSSTEPTSSKREMMRHGSRFYQRGPREKAHPNNRSSSSSSSSSRLPSKQPATLHPRPPSRSPAALPPPAASHVAAAAASGIGTDPHDPKTQPDDHNNPSDDDDETGGQTQDDTDGDEDGEEGQFCEHCQCFPEDHGMRCLFRALYHDRVEEVPTIFPGR